MQDLQTAKIIAFPPQPTASDRLSAALAELSVALTRQQEAMRRWHDAMADLAQGLHRLSGSTASAMSPPRLK